MGVVSCKRPVIGNSLTATAQIEAAHMSWRLSSQEVAAEPHAGLRGVIGRALGEFSTHLSARPGRNAGDLKRVKSKFSVLSSATPATCRCYL